jgi:hypothetical protein
MRTELVSAKTLVPGDEIIAVDKDINLVPVEIGRVTPIKRDGKVVAYKVYPQRWMAEMDAVARDKSLSHFRPKTYTTHAKVEKVVAR